MNKIEQLLKDVKKIKVVFPLDLKPSIVNFISGYDTTTKQSCLLKMIPLADSPTQLVDPEKLEELSRENQILKNCTNKNILKYIDSFQIENYYFIQLERPQKTLEDWIKEKKSIVETKEDFFNVCGQIVNAMSYLHHYNRFLMDLSADTIFISEEKEVKILSTKFVNTSDDRELIFQKYLQSGRDGKYFFYSPEMLTAAMDIWGSNIKRREKCDIWTLGIIVLMLLRQDEEFSIKLHTQDCSSYQYTKIDASINTFLHENIFNQNPQKRLNIQSLLGYFNVLQPIKSISKQSSTSTTSSKLAGEEARIEKNGDTQKKSDELELRSQESDVKSQEGSNDGQPEKQGKKGDKKKRKVSKKSYEEAHIKEEEETEKEVKQQDEQEEEKKEDLNKKKVEEEEKKEVVIDEQYLKLLLVKQLGKQQLSDEVINIKSHLDKNPKDVLALKVIARLYQKRGMQDQEISNYKQIIELSDNEPEIHLALGKAYLQRDRSDEAMEQFKLCFEKDNKQIEAVIKMVDNKITLKQYDKAEEIVESGLKVNDNHPQLLFKMGQVLKFKNRFEEALKYYDLTLKIDNTIKECSQDRVNVFRRIKDLEIAEYAKILEVDDTNFKVLYKLGVAYKEKEQIPQAIDSFNKSLAIYPIQSLVCLELGNCFFLQNNLKQALQKYKESITINPKCVSTWHQIGQLYLRKKKVIKAVKSFLTSENYSATKSYERYIQICELIKKQMDNCRQKVIKIAQSFEIKQLKEAVENYQFSSELDIYSLKKQLQYNYTQSLILQDSFDKYYHTLGLLYLAYRVPKKAILQFQKCLLLNEFNRECILDLAAAYGITKNRNQCMFYSCQAIYNYDKLKRNYLNLKEKRISKSLKSKNILIDQYPTEELSNALRSKAYYNLGICYENQLFSCLKYYSKALKLEPQNIESWFRAGVQFGLIQQYDNAIECFQSCIKINKYHALSHKSLKDIYSTLKLNKLESIHQKNYLEAMAQNKGIFYMNNQEYEKSVKAFLKWDELNPISIDCQYLLSEVMRLIGNSDSQIHYLKKCLELNPTHEESLSRIYELQKGDNTVELLSKSAINEENRDHIEKVIQNMNWDYQESEANELSSMVQERSNTHNSFKSAIYMKSKLDLNKAIVHFLDYLQTEPKDYLGHFLLGNIYEKKSEYQLAAESYEKCIKLKPEENFNGYFKLGMVNKYQGKFNDALYYLLIADKAMTNNESVMCAIAQCYQKVKKYEEAAKFFNYCKEKCPTNQFYDFYLLLIKSRSQNLIESFPVIYKQTQSLLETYKGKGIPEDVQSIIDCIMNEKEHSSSCSGFCNYQIAKQSIAHKKVEEAVEYLRKAIRSQTDYLPFKLAIAQNLIVIKKFDKALEEVDVILNEEPDNYDANYAACQCYFEKGLFEQSIKYLQICNELKPDSFEIIKLMADSYKELKKGDLAIENYLICKDMRPLNSDILTSLADCYRTTGQTHLAVENYKKCLEMNAKHADSYYQYANILIGMAEYAEAVTVLQECIKIDTHHFDANNLMGQAYIQLNLINKAIQAFKKQGQVNKLNKTYMLNMGKAYIKLDNVSEAITCLSKFMNMNPGTEETYDLLCGLFQRQKQPKKQVKILESLYAIDQSRTDILLRIAGILYRERCYSEAADVYEKYLTFQNNTEEIQFKITMCYVKSHQNKDSIIALEKCLSLYPNLKECNFHLASIYFDEKKYELSKKHLAITLEENPGHIQGLFIQAKLLYLEKKYEKALELLDICVNTCDQLPNIYYHLACCYKKLDMKDYATPCFQAALVKNPDSIECKIEMGYNFVKIKEYQKAIDQLKTLQRTDDPKFFFYLAEAYFYNSQFAEAQTYYQKCFDCEFGKYSKKSFQMVYSSLMKQKKYNEIKATLKKCLDRNPNEPEILYYSAQVYLEEGLNYEESYNFVKRCLEINKDFNKCKILSAFYFLKVEKDMKKTIDFVKEFSEDFIEENIYALQALAEAHFEMKEYKQSRDYLKKMFFIEKNSESAIYLQGLFFLKNGEIDQALAEFQKNTSHDKSFYQVGLIKKKQKKVDEARSAFIRAIQLYGYNPAYHKAVAKLEFGLKDYTKANQYFTSYINQIAEPEVEITNMQAQCYFNLKQYNEAEKQLTISISKKPDSNSYQLLGSCYLQLVNYVQAEKSFRSSIELNNLNSESHFLLGNVLRINSDVLKAKESYLSCIAIKKDHGLCLNYLGEIYYKEKDYKNAKKCLTESTLHDTQNPNSLINLGKYFQKAEKNTVNAEDNYKKSLALDKTNKRGAKKLAKLYISLNKYDEADATITTYIALFADDVKNLLIFANYCFSKRQFDSAMIYFEKALLKEPTSQECQIKIASCYFMKKQFPKCEDLLKLHSKNLDKTFEYNLLSVQLLLLKENDTKVVSLLRKCREIQSQNENSHFFQSYFLYTKNSKNMKENFDEGYKICPNSNELGLILNGIILQEQGKQEEAAKSYNRCLELFPKSELCLLTFGYFQISLGKYEEAKNLLVKCLNQELHNLSSIYSKPLSSKQTLKCNYGLALAFNKLNDSEKALKYIQSCLDLNSNDADTIQLHAKILHQNGNLPQSIYNFQKYLQLNPQSDEVQFLLGNARLESGSPDQAIFSLKKCLAINPFYPNINSTLGEAYELDQQYKEALLCYYKQMERTPDNSKILFKIVLILISFDSYTQASSVIQRLIQLTPKDFLVYSAKGMLYKRQSKFQEAITAFNESLQIEPLNIYTLFNLALCYGETGNTKKEKQCYQQILKQNPNEKKALNNLGNINRSKGKYDKAIQLFNQCIKIDSYFCEYHTNLGLCYVAKGDYDQAITCFQRGYSTDRINIDCLLNMASAYKTKGEPQQAIKYLQKIIRLNPNYISAYYNLAILQKQLGNITDAIANYKICTEKDPSHINSKIQLAICYREQNDYDNSKKLLKSALELDATNELANFNIALLYRKKFKYAKELKSLQKALEQSPTNAKYLHNIGLCHRQADNLQEALIYMKQSLFLDDANPTYYYNLADVQHSLRLYEDEINSYKKCIQLHSNFEKAYVNLGVVYLYQNKFQEAIDTFLKCVDLNANSENNFFNLGYAYQLNGNPEKSIEYYKKCLDLNENHIKTLNNIAIDYTKQKQYAQAIACYERCMNITPSDEFRKKISTVYGLLGKSS